MIRTTALALLLAASFTAHANPEAAAKPDPAKGKPIAEGVCGACHGTDGNSLAAANPNLAGQVPEYIAKQISNFKPGADGKPALRNNAIMSGMAATLATEEDVKNVAAYFAEQKLKPQEAKDEKLVAQGQKLWRAGDVKKGIPACAGCHGAAGAGLPAQFPRLAGQWAEYTENQLKQFRSGERGNDPEKMMRTIAAKMSDQEIKAVAEYAAGLR
ncbi:cytochrome c [Azospira sp. I13]|jgi:cytochrome c553|uniref:c-type cytochrome n=1 Tax=Azospira sp. I13 TaxID=1765050 RepID=UPI000D3F3287|nr:c-type cytochrome [Azospira sp. I13]GBG02015.1 cytochrome c [Azospira sp. I13]